MNARYAVHCGIKSDEMTLVMLRACLPEEGFCQGDVVRSNKIPRLKRLFRNKEHTKLLRWHKEDRKSDEMSRHAADGSQ